MPTFKHDLTPQLPFRPEHAGYGTPVDITEIINAARNLRAKEPIADTIIFVGYRVKGNAKQKKRIRFRNRKLLARIAESPYLEPIPPTPGIMGKIHELRREIHNRMGIPARIDDPVSDEDGREKMRGIWREREARRKKL